MTIKYDKESDSKYVRINKGVVATTKKEHDWLFFDYTKDGEVVGVEVLNASKHPISITTMLGMFAGYHVTKFSEKKEGPEP